MNIGKARLGAACALAAFLIPSGHALAETDLEKAVAGGARKLNETEMSNTLRGNTQSLKTGPIFYKTNGTRIVSWRGKRFVTGWSIDAAGRLCATAVPEKGKKCEHFYAGKWEGGVVEKRGYFMTFDEAGKLAHSFKVHKGNWANIR